jgi:hypothetical protein
MLFFYSPDTDTKTLFMTFLDAIDELVSVLPGIAMNDILRKPIQRTDLLSKVKIALHSPY